MRNRHQAEGDPLIEIDTPVRESSRLILGALALCVSLIIAGAVSGVIWLSSEQDRLAADNQRLMVQGGIQNLIDTLQRVTLDFAIWPAAVDALARSDMPWVWENIGISAAETETTDLMMVIPADGGAPYGWTPGMSYEPSTALLTPEAIDRMMEALDTVPILERRAPARFADVEGELWLLTAARIVSNEEAEVPEDDGAIPRLLFGFKVTDALLADIGRSSLIEDLTLSDRPRPGDPSVALPLDAENPLRHVVWSAFKPGLEVIRTLALPLLAGITALIAISAVTGRFIFGIARQLESAYRQARAADLAKTSFLANVSHELRTPMNGVIGIAMLLERTDLDREQRNMLEMLQSAANAQMLLISDLLDITMIESGQMRLRDRPFDAREAAEEVITMQQFEADKKDLELTLEVVSPLGQVTGDVDRFKQILIILVNNAIQATNSGWVRVRLGRTGSGPGRRLVLEVADTGPGIPSEDRKRIFERFVRLSEVGTRSHRGTGLGLTIARSLVTLMRGTITVASTLGRGSVFRVEIPFVRGEDAYPPSAQAEGASGA